MSSADWVNTRYPHHFLGAQEGAISVVHAVVVGERKHVETLAALQPNGFRVAGNEKILAFHIVVQMRFNGMRVAHLLRIGPFAISEEIGSASCRERVCQYV